MKGNHGILPFLVSAGMELCYLYACTSFATTLFFHHGWPFPESVACFLLAALLARFSAGRGWRVISVVALQALGFLPALFRMVGVFDSWADSFASQTFIDPAWFIESQTSPTDYFVPILVILWAFVFWVGGVELTRRPLDHPALCARFDRGLIAFFVIFLTKLYLQVGQGIRVDDPNAVFLIFPFFIFSLLAIGLVRDQSGVQRDFLPGYQTIGVMLGFIIVVFLVGTGLVFFFLPLLTLAAEKGNDILGVVSGPLLSIVFAITNWLFGTDFSIDQQPPVENVQTPQAVSPWNMPGWLELLSRILSIGVGIIVALVFLAIIAALVYLILRWLFSKTAVDSEPSPQNPFSPNALRALVEFLWRGLVHYVKGYQRAIELYTALRAWGRISGKPHFVGETPSEYGSRLIRLFPALGGEIDLIVKAFNQEVYGEIVLSHKELAPARSAWQKLASPRHWPMRFKTWFARP